MKDLVRHFYSPLLISAYTSRAKFKNIEKASEQQKNGQPTMQMPSFCIFAFNNIGDCSSSNKTEIL